MAQGDFFEIAVAYPLKNHKFRQPTYYQGLLASQGTSPPDNFTFIDSVNEGNVVGEGDRFNMEDANTGEVNEYTVRRANWAYPALTVGIRGLHSGSVALNSIATFRGSSKLAAGWVRTGTAANASQDAHRARILTTKPYGGSAPGSGRFAQVFRSGSGATGVDENGIEQILNSSLIMPYTYYRIGCNYRIEVVNLTGFASAFCRLHDSARFYPNQSFGSVDVLTWSHFKSNSFFVQDANGTNDAKLQFLIELGGSSDEITLWLSDVVVEHAGQIKGVTRIKSTSNPGGGSTWVLIIYDTLANFGVQVGDEIAVVNRGSGTYAIVVVTAIGSLSSGNIVTTFQSGSTTAIQQDARLEIKNGGSFVFSDNPEQTSLDYRPIEETNTVKLLDNSLRLFSPAMDGERSERWSFRCRFTTFPQEDWDALMKLMRWQANGNLLTLRTYIDDLPQPMVGRIVLANIRKSTSWSLVYRDFDLIFVEAAL